jgi:hypothetical protein
MSSLFSRVTCLSVSAALLMSPLAQAQQNRIPPLNTRTDAFNSAKGVDANDLNILFAVDNATGALVPNIALGDANFADDARQQARTPDGARRRGNGGLLTRKIFDQVKVATKQNGIGTTGDNFDDWRVVAMRYDSCFPTFDPVKDPTGANCIEQVRLITQPISGTKKTGEDTTMHLLYSVKGFSQAFGLAPKKGTNVEGKGAARRLSKTFKQLLALKEGALALGVDTNRKAMGPHPALTNSASQREFADKVFEFIANNTAPEKLMVITYMGLDAAGGGQPWIFLGGNVLPAPVTETTASGRQIVRQFGPGNWTIAPQPGSAPFASIKFDNKKPATDALDVAGKIDPHPVVPFSEPARPNRNTLGALLNLRPGSPAALQIAETAVNFTVDPVKTTPDIGDCASCHLTSLRRLHNVAHVFGPQQTGSPNAFPRNLAQAGLPANLVAQAVAEHDGISAFVEAANLPKAGQGADWNTRNFGYFSRSTGPQPTVAEITAISARAVAAFTNKQIQQQNPGIRCTGAGWERMNQCLEFDPAGGTLANCLGQKTGCQ